MTFQLGNFKAFNLACMFVGVYESMDVFLEYWLSIFFYLDIATIMLSFKH